MSFVLQIDYYAEGEKVLTLAPGLVILIADRSRQPADSTELKERCGKCGEHLHTWEMNPSQQSELYSLTGRPPFQYLACECLCVVHGAHLTRQDIITRWKEFRRLQNRVLGWATYN
jgi:hypothetical protein